MKKTPPVDSPTNPSSENNPKTPRQGTPHYGHFGDKPNPSPDASAPDPDPLGVHQNLDTAGVLAAQQGGVSEAELRDAYARDDPRYAGGDKFDLKNEQTDW